MSYVERTLADGERIEARARLHWLIWVRAFIVLLLFGIILVGVLFFIAEWLRITSTEVVLTDRRLVLKRGVFTRHTNELELSSVETINLDQSAWGRVFDFGHLNVQGTGDDAWTTPMIGAPLRFRRAIEAALIHRAPSQSGRPTS